MKHLYFFLLIALFFTSQSCQKEKQVQEHAEEHKGHSHANEGGCAHCGMDYTMYPKWKASFESPAKGMLMFCSNRCMLLTSIKEKDQLGEITGIQVQDYYDLKAIDGQSAFYVTGSDVLGPMGHDFVPFSSKEAAEEFVKDHSGKNIYSFEEVTMEVITSVVNQ